MIHVQPGAEFQARIHPSATIIETEIRSPTGKLLEKLPADPVVHTRAPTDAGLVFVVWTFEDATSVGQVVDVTDSDSADLEAVLAALDVPADTDRDRIVLEWALPGPINPKRPRLSLRDRIVEAGRPDPSAGGPLSDATPRF